MKNPDLTDRLVKVTAYLTDETFGHDYWAARQFTAPNVPSRRNALLIICESERVRDEMFNVLLMPPGPNNISWDDRGVRTVNGVPDDKRTDKPLVDILRENLSGPVGVTGAVGPGPCPTGEPGVEGLPGEARDLTITDVLKKLTKPGEMALSMSVQNNQLRIDFGAQLDWLKFDAAHLDLFIAMLTEKRKELHDAQ